MRFCQTIVFVLALSSCATDQEFSESFHNSELLAPGSLELHGLAFITPSTVTGQEEDTQALALAFAKVFSKNRPEIHLTKLSQTLSLINQHHLVEDYKGMYDAYRDTGILNADILKEIGQVTRSRYLIQLKLANFRQGASTRLNLLGLRASQTNKANIRLFMQIWDSQTGTICFEGSEELNKANESTSEQPISFKSLVTQAAANLLNNVP